MGVSFEKRKEKNKDSESHVFLKGEFENNNDTKLRQNEWNYEISELLKESFNKSHPLNKVLSLIKDHQVPQDIKEDSVIQYFRSHWDQPYLEFTSDQYSDKLNESPV